LQRGNRTVPVPPCSWQRRVVGLALAYSDRLRSVALRIFEWRNRNSGTNPELVSQGARLG
jgi:hypothetical protein